MPTAFHRMLFFGLSETTQLNVIGHRALWRKRRESSQLLRYQGRVPINHTDTTEPEQSDPPVIYPSQDKGMKKKGFRKIDGLFGFRAIL